MPSDVVITGVGIISAIGNGTEETLSSLFSLKSGIGAFKWLDSIHSEIPVAEVKLSNHELAVIAGVDLKSGIYTRNTLLAQTAARQAAESSGWSRLPAETTGLILATTVGGMDHNERIYRPVLSGDTETGPIPVLDSSDTTEKIAAAFGIKHQVTTISTACSSSANAIMLGARLISSGKCSRVMVGGSDALTRFTINGFKGLELLSPEGCRPFDAHRDGLTIGEGAAVLILESGRVADKSRIIGRIAGYANVNEAYHQTSSSPEGTGAFMAMSQCLDNASLRPEDIGYINAHGTGTEVNDLAEGIAISRLFGRNIPPVSSTKAYTGHTLGAAGAIEAVISLLALQNQTAWPALNLRQTMPELSFSPPVKAIPAAINHVLSNSFGFGGNNTSLIFSKP